MLRIAEHARAAVPLGKPSLIRAERLDATGIKNRPRLPLIVNALLTLSTVTEG
jgi:hypothetical protein